MQGIGSIYILIKIFLPINVNRLPLHGNCPLVLGVLVDLPRQGVGLEANVDLP